MLELNNRIVRGKEFLYLNRNDIENLNFKMNDIIGFIEKGFIEKGKGNFEMPPKPGIHTKPNSFIHAMPCSIPEYSAAGMKWVSGYPENYKYNLPYITGLLILNCPDTGVPLAVMDCIWITEKRTAAASAVAAKYLAKKNTEILGIIGCGVQGKSNLEAIYTVSNGLKKVKAYDVNEQKLEKYVNEAKRKYENLDILAVKTPKEAVIDSDIVITSTPILKKPSPIIEKEWFQEGMLGIALDFDSYWKYDSLNLADKYYVDDTDQHNYYKDHEGYFSQTPAIYADLGEIVTKKKQGRTNNNERIIAMNLGLALEDMVTAINIFNKAIQLNRGTILTL